MIDVIEFFTTCLVNFYKLLYTDFSPLTTYRKSQMRSAVSGSSTYHAILRHGVRYFFLAYREDGDEGLDQAMGTKVERPTHL
jgi:hypothetical protein